MAGQRLDEGVEVPAPERLLRPRDHRLCRRVDCDARVPVRPRDQRGELVGERRRVEVPAPAQLRRELSVLERAEQRDAVPLVGEVELVVGEEDRHAADAARARALDHGLDLTGDGVDVSRQMLAPQVRRQAVHALHRAADSRPHRDRVDGRVERLPQRQAVHGEPVRSQRVGLAAAHEPGDAVELGAGGDALQHLPERELAGPDDAVLDVEVVEALAGHGRERRSAEQEERVGCGLGDRAPQPQQFGHEPDEVERPVVRAAGVVHDDAVLDHAHAEADDGRPQPPRRLRRGLERAVGHEVRVDDLDLGARIGRRRADALEPVGRHRHHLLEGVRVHQQHAGARLGARAHRVKSRCTGIDVPCPRSARGYAEVDSRYHRRPPVWADAAQRAR